MVQVYFCNIPFLSTDYSTVVDFSSKSQRTEFFNSYVLYNHECNIKFDGERTSLTIKVPCETIINYDYNMYDIIRNTLKKSVRYDVRVIDYLPSKDVPSFNPTIEAEVDKEVLRVAHVKGADEARLVEGGAHLVDVAELAAVGLRGGTGRRGHIAAAVHADGGRVGAHGGEVGTEGVHGATHAHETGRTVQVTAREHLHFVYVLCLQAAAEGQACKGYK